MAPMCKLCGQERHFDTTNDYMVGGQGDMIRIMRPPTKDQGINKQTALRFAATIVALADDNDEFIDILNAVQNA